MINYRLQNAVDNYYGSTPVVFIDTDQVVENFNKIVEGFNGEAFIHYAMKANPNDRIIVDLDNAGCKFDAASIGEINRLLDLGVEPDHISYGNTIKKAKDIRAAYAAGINMYAADSEMELDKLAKYAPNSMVFIRMLVASSQAEWPLSRKFGCSSSSVIKLLKLAKTLGLKPYGISFHVGSQARHPHMWEDVLDTVSVIWKEAETEGIALQLLNIGGGFPCKYTQDITPLQEYCEILYDMIIDRFGYVNYLMVEPGRAMVANAGVIISEVVLISKKHEHDDVPWVYLDIGKFNGLAETMEEAIVYDFYFTRDHLPIAPIQTCIDAIIAGPTCDSADTLYERNLIPVPPNLTHGDRVIIENTGAYTTTYSSVWFNGFEPLKEIVL